MDADASQQIQSVLMTADAVGGVWTYALTLAGALQRAGITVYLATMGPRPSEDQRREAGAVGNVVLFESEFRLEWMDDPWEDVRRAGDWLLDLERNLNPDIVHLNGYTHAALDWEHPVVCVGHSCVLSWWRAVKREDAPASWARYHEEVRGGLAAADIVIAPSRAMLSELESSYGLLRSARVVSNGCDPAAFVPRRKEPIIFSAGRLWDEAKNIRALDEVAAKLQWPVYLGGEGYMGGGAKCLGRLSCAQMRHWYGRAAIYALPARYEPFGLSVLEAALSGCALVLGDIPSLKENWQGTAIFVPVEDPKSLQDALDMLIGDDEARQALAARSRERAAQFTPEHMAAGYLNAYAEVSKSRQVKTCV